MEQNQSYNEMQTTAPPDPIAPMAPPEPIAPMAPPEPIAPMAPPEPIAPMAPPEPVAPMVPPEPVAPMAPPDPVYSAPQNPYGVPVQDAAYQQVPPNAGWSATTPPPQGATTEKKPINRLALIGFCLAVASWVFNYITFCLLGIAGVVVSVLAMKRMDKEKENYPWMPIAGIAIGAAATIIDGIIIISILGVIGLPIILGTLGSLGSF